MAALVGLVSVSDSRVLGEFLVNLFAISAQRSFLLFDWHGVVENWDLVLCVVLVPQAAGSGLL